MPRFDAAAVDTAVRDARTAFEAGAWRDATGAHRASVLLRAAELIERDLADIALMETRESGKPIAQARAEIGGAVDIWRYAAALARTVHGETQNALGPDLLGMTVRDPVGVVAVVTPWNFPFLTLSQKLPFALAAGCSVVMKPSELTSGSTLRAARLLAEAGLPDGVARVVTGTGPETGAPLMRHPEIDMISFTGSTRVGREAIAAAADGIKKVSLELGGKNPQIVFADADLDAAADAIVFGAWFNAGECCNAGSRLLVERSVEGALLDKVVALSRNVRTGDPMDEATQVGAIIHEAHLEGIERRVAAARDAGARVLLGGERLGDGPGLYMAPTVVADVRPDMEIASAEVFGPVLSAIAFDTEAEALEIANATAYGLSAGVWSGAMDRCLRMGRGLRAGTVWMNTFMDGAPELPFGGYRQSGVGRELGPEAVLDYTETKTFTMRMNPRTPWAS